MRENERERNAAAIAAAARRCWSIFRERVERSGDPPLILVALLRWRSENFLRSVAGLAPVARAADTSREGPRDQKLKAAFPIVRACLPHNDDRCSFSIRSRLSYTIAFAPYLESSFFIFLCLIFHDPIFRAQKIKSQKSYLIFRDFLWT